MWVSERFFLLIEPLAVRLYRWRKQGVTKIADFAPDAAGLADFAQWRQQEPERPLSVLADLPDEGFVVESIPQLSGAERREVIKRKIQRHFPDTPYVAARALLSEERQGEKAKRKDEVILLSALPAVFLHDWLALAKPLSGLYALIQLFEAAGKRLGLPGDAIVLTRRGDWVRQTWLQAGIPCFSRLIRLRGENLREETGRLLTYLARLSTRPLQTDLPLCPLFALSDTERESLSAEFALMPDSNVLADDDFFLALLAEQPPKAQYAPDKLRQGAYPPELRRLVLAGGVICLAAGAAFTAYGLREAALLSAQTAGVLREVKDSEERLAAWREKEGDKMFDAERAARLLSQFPEKMSDTLAADLQVLSRVLDGLPALTVENLDWEAAGRKMILEIKDADANAISAFQGAAQRRGFQASNTEGVDGGNGVVRLTLTRE